MAADLNFEQWDRSVAVGQGGKEDGLGIVPIFWANASLGLRIPITILLN